MLVTKALPQDVAFLAFVPSLRRRAFPAGVEPPLQSTIFLSTSPHHMLTNNDALDFACAFVNLCNFCVAEIAFHRIVFGIAVAA